MGHHRVVNAHPACLTGSSLETLAEVLASPLVPSSSCSQGGEQLSFDVTPRGRMPGGGEGTGEPVVNAYTTAR